MNGTIKTKVCLVCKQYEVCYCTSPYFLEVQILRDMSRRFETSVSGLVETKRTPLCDLIFARRMAEKQGGNDDL
jgi:hypothetical protein